MTSEGHERDSEGPLRGSWRERYIRMVVTHPRTVLVLWGLLMAGSAAFLPYLTKDTTLDNHLSANHPSVKLWRQTNAQFDLYDPVVVLVDSGRPMGAFTPQTLQLVDWFTHEMTQVDGLEPDSVQSIATESRIYGTPEGVESKRLMASPPDGVAEAEAIREATMGFEPYLGLLVSQDGSAAVLTARLSQEGKGGQVYSALRKLVERAPLHGETIYIAGEAVMGDRLGQILDRDAFRLNPLVAIVVGVVLFLSYRTLWSLALPGLAAFSGIVVAMGFMALFKIPYYLMTNILPAVLLALGVAYGLHVVGEYYERLAADPGEPPVERVVNATLRMWRPVVFTAFTDVAAFLDLTLTSSMPPLRRFGSIATLGVLVTFAFTLMAIPAVLALLPSKSSPVFRHDRPGERHTGRDLWHRVIDALNRFVVSYPRWIVGVSALMTVFALWAATYLEVNDERASNFSPSEPIRQAAHAINAATDGTVILDIVVETDEPEGLFHPDVLRRIEALERYAKSFPTVGDTLSIVDFVKQINRALSEDAPEAAVIPDTEEMVAQAFLVASMNDLSKTLVHYVDADFRVANVRVFHKSGYHSDVKRVREALEEYVRTQFNGPGIRAHLSGRMDVFYNWMETIAFDHFTSVFVGLAVVWLVVSLSFRFFWIGLYAVIPVSATLVGIYAAMGLGGITLGIGTAAFAAIAIGLTVDFAIHVLDHMLVLTREERRPLPEAVTLMYPSTGRAVFFSFLCVFLGMCVLTQSELPPVYLFAVLLAVSLVVSFLGSMVLLPALLLVIKPKFLTAWPVEPSAVETANRKLA